MPTKPMPIVDLRKPKLADRPRASRKLNAKEVAESLSRDDLRDIAFIRLNEQGYDLQKHAGLTLDEVAVLYFSAGASLLTLPAHPTSLLRQYDTARARMLANAVITGLEMNKVPPTKMTRGRAK
jgi:hypothetical protein